MRIEYKEITHQRKFGVELEVSPDVSKLSIGRSLEFFEKVYGLNKPVCVTSSKKGWAETKANDYWHVKYDSTCGPGGKGMDYGWEIASYIAQGQEDLLNIGEAAQWMQEMISTNENCGLHIHVDTSDFSQREMGLLLTHWMFIEHILIAICNPCREKNYYCRSLWPLMAERISFNPWISTNNPLDFWKLMQPKNFNTHNNDEKKYAINTVGFATGQIIESHNRKTVELRLPECKLSREHVLGWTILFLNFVDTCRFLEPTYPIHPSYEMNHILRLLGLEGRGDFWIFDEHLTKTKKWFLKKLSESQRVSNLLRKRAANHLVFISEI